MRQSNRRGDVIDRSTHRNNAFEAAIQLVDVLEDGFHALLGLLECVRLWSLLLGCV